MAEEKKTGGKKHITGARIAKEIRQYKKDALLSPMYTTLCVVLEILIPYLTASIIDKGIAVGDMEHVAKIGSLMAVMAILAMFCGIRAGIHSARASTGLAAICASRCSDAFRIIPFPISTGSPPRALSRA